MRRVFVFVCCAAILSAGVRPAAAEGEWEITPGSEAALKKGLDWLAKNQGPEGNWGSPRLGLVSMAALAFLSAGETGTTGYGVNTHKALAYVVEKAKPSGLLNITDPFGDMYNHGLSTFVLGQAYGMTRDRRIGPVLDRALRLIVATQCQDGGWDYKAAIQGSGHDLSLAVMQAKALRSAMDSGFEVPPQAVMLAIKSVREHYVPADSRRDAPEAQQRLIPGVFTYSGANYTDMKLCTAMAAAGVVCLQEFGQYDDWRIPKNLDKIVENIGLIVPPKSGDGSLPFSAYALYYVGQALYQVGGKHWEENYPKLRDYLVTSQGPDGSWLDKGHLADSKTESPLWGTSVACFFLAIPNRYLPILQEGKIDSLRGKYQKEKE